MALKLNIYGSRMEYLWLLKKGNWSPVNCSFAELNPIKNPVKVTQYEALLNSYRVETINKKVLMNSEKDCREFTASIELT